jgi:hypothetical protein
LPWALLACSHRSALLAALLAARRQWPIKPDAILVSAGHIAPVCCFQELVKGKQIREGLPAGGQISLEARLTQESGDTPQVPARQAGSRGALIDDCVGTTVVSV